MRKGHPYEKISSIWALQVTFSLTKGVRILATFNNQIQRHYCAIRTVLYLRILSRLEDEHAFVNLCHCFIDINTDA